MFFYLVNNSNLFNKSVSKNDKYIKLLIYGTIAYIVLHAILFVGGKEALFYNFRYYYIYNNNKLYIGLKSLRNTKINFYLLFIAL